MSQVVNALMSLLVMLLLSVGPVTIVMLYLKTARRMREKEGRFQAFAAEHGLTHRSRPYLHCSINQVYGELNGKPFQLYEDVQNYGKGIVWTTYVRFPDSSRGFEFRINRKSIFTRGDKKLKTGNSAFDRCYALETNNGERFQRLLSDVAVVGLLQLKPHFRGEIKKDKAGCSYSFRGSAISPRQWNDLQAVIGFMEHLVAAPEMIEDHPSRIAS